MRESSAEQGFLAPKNRKCGDSSHQVFVLSSAHSISCFVEKYEVCSADFFHAEKRQVRAFFIRKDRKCGDSSRDFKVCSCLRGGRKLE